MKEYKFLSENNNDFIGLLRRIIKHKDRNIIITRDTASKFLDQYRTMFPNREFSIKRENNELIYSFDLSIILDDEVSQKASLKILDDQTHSGRYKILSCNFAGVGYYKANNSNCDDMIICANKQDFNDNFKEKEL